MKEKSEKCSIVDIEVIVSYIKIYMNDILLAIFKEKDENFNIYEISGFKDFINNYPLPNKEINSNSIKKSSEYKIIAQLCKRIFTDEYYYSSLLISRYINASVIDQSYFNQKNKIIVSLYKNNFGNRTLEIIDLSNKKKHTNKDIDITNIEPKEKKDQITLTMKNFSSKENLANSRKILSSIRPDNANFVMDENKIFKEDEKDILIEDIMNDKKNYMESITNNNENINKMSKSLNQAIKGIKLTNKLGELENHFNFMIIGKTGCIKSLFLNSLNEMLIQNQAQSQSSEVNTHYICPLTIMDMPGITGGIKETNIMNEVFEDIYRREVISHIVYVYPKKIFNLYNKSLCENLLQSIKFSPFTILFIGTTNVGKSNLLNSLIRDNSFLVQHETNKDECIEGIIWQINKGLSINNFVDHIFLIKDYETNKRDKDPYINSLDYKEDKKAYRFEKKLKLLDFFNENRHFYCKKCYSFPIVKLEDNKLCIICNCEDDKFGKENEKIKNIFEYIINKNELINNEKENFITSSFCCNKHIKKYKYYCKICQKNLCRKCLQNEEEHHDHDLVLFDSNLDEIDEKIDYIKQVINKKINIINNIYFNGKKIDIEELFTLIINDYSEYKSYNLIKSIENFYEFLFFEKKKNFSFFHCKCWFFHSTPDEPSIEKWHLSNSIYMDISSIVKLYNLAENEDEDGLFDNFESHFKKKIYIKEQKYELDINYSS